MSATEMSVEGIMQELTLYRKRFPRAAVEAAIAQRETITPHLLKALEEVAAAPEEYASRSDYMLHTYALYLLAQFREKRAYAPAIQLLRAPRDLPDALLGDTITEGLMHILGSIYDGHPAPLQRLVEGESVNEWVRGSALDTFLVLVHSGQMSREEACAYLRSLFEGRLKREYHHVWDELACVVADLPAPELLGLVRAAYEKGLVDPCYADFEDLARDAQNGTSERLAELGKRYRLIEDTVAEMEWWAAFRDDAKDAEAAEPEDDEDYWRLHEPSVDDLAPEPVVTPSLMPFVRNQPRIGRNEPCPCGSGLKFKKCCLDKK